MGRDHCSRQDARVPAGPYRNGQRQLQRRRPETGEIIGQTIPPSERTGSQLNNAVEVIA